MIKYEHITFHSTSTNTISNMVAVYVVYAIMTVSSSIKRKVHKLYFKQEKYMNIVKKKKGSECLQLTSV